MPFQEGPVEGRGPLPDPFPAAIFTLRASKPVERVFRSWSLRMRNGRPYSSKAKLPMADMTAVDPPEGRRTRPQLTAQKEREPRLTKALLAGSTRGQKKRMRTLLLECGAHYILEASGWGGAYASAQAHQNCIAFPSDHRARKHTYASCIHCMKRRSL